jgi:drug/metabolite transporter (DMT)-like permease
VSSDSSRHRVAAGIALKLGAVGAFGIMFATVKIAGDAGVHSMETLFFRSVFALVPVVAFMVATRRLDLFRTQRPLGHLVRGTWGLSSMICGFAAVGLMPLAEFTTLTFAAPLFITALSVPVLGERVGKHRWAAVAVGFAGVLIALKPDPVHLVGLGPLLALAAAVGTAGAMLAIRQIGATEPGPTIAFYFTLYGAVVGAVTLPFVWTTPSLPIFAALVVCGLSGGVGQLMLSQAFRIAPAAVVAPFDYAALPWMSLIGYLMWKEVPSRATLIGGCVIVASGLYILWREVRVRRQGPTAGDMT